MSLSQSNIYFTRFKSCFFFFLYVLTYWEINIIIICFFTFFFSFFFFFFCFLPGSLYIPKEIKDGKSENKKGRETQSASSLGLKGQQAHVWDAKVRSEVAAKKAIEERDVNSKEYGALIFSIYIFNFSSFYIYILFFTRFFIIYIYVD